MKLNFAYLGSQKFIEIDDEKRLRCLYDKRISQEVPGEDLGEEFSFQNITSQPAGFYLMVRWLMKHDAVSISRIR